MQLQVLNLYTKLLAYALETIFFLLLSSAM